MFKMRSYKKLIIILFIILFHQFSSGYWIFGFAVPQVTSLAMDSDGQCIKYTGEVNPCSQDERYLLVSLKKLYD